MAIVKTKGIVLHTIPYKETSLIARVLSPNYGVISIIAKGAKRKKSMTGVHFSFLNTLVLEIYYSPSRDLHTLKESELLVGAAGLAEKILPYAVGQLLADVVLHTAHGSEGAQELYFLIDKGFSYLNDCKDMSVETSYVFVSRFLIQIARVYGFELNLENCVECYNLLRYKPAFFSIERGGCICEHCTEQESQQNRELALALIYMGQKSEIPKELQKHCSRIEETLFKYIMMHTEIAIKLKSLEYLQTVRAF